LPDDAVPNHDLRSASFPSSSFTRATWERSSALRAARVTVTTRTVLTNLRPRPPGSGPRRRRAPESRA